MKLMKNQLPDKKLISKEQGFFAACISHEKFRRDKVTVKKFAKTLFAKISE